jgi:hypothetical protein
MAKILPIHKTIPHIHNLHPQPNKSPKQRANPTRPPKYSTKNLQYTHRYPPKQPTTNNAKFSHTWKWTPTMDLSLKATAILPLPNAYYRTYLHKLNPQQYMYTNRSFIPPNTHTHTNSKGSIEGNTKLYLPDPKRIVAKCTSPSPKCLSLGVKFK